MRPAHSRLLLLALLWLAQPVQALHWQLDAGSGRAAANPGGGHDHGHTQGESARPESGTAPQPTVRMRHGTVPQLSDSNGVEVTLWKPEAQRIELADKQPRLPRTAPGYYQALVAVREHDQGEDSAIHYLRLRSPEEPDLRGWFSFRPENRISPAELTTARKARLEIVPAPLPREMRTYHEGMRATFQVRLDGQPLGGASVGLRTANGSILIEETDPRGRVTFILPMDFTEVLPGRNATPPAQMVLRTVYRSDEQRFATSLTMPYGPHPSNWQSAGWAFGLLLMGMIGGGLLGRRVVALAPAPGKSRKKIIIQERKA
jgi:hypothetical protein